MFVVTGDCISFAAITNCYKLSGLNNTNLLSYRSGGQKYKMDHTGLNEGDLRSIPLLAPGENTDAHSHCHGFHNLFIYHDSINLCFYFQTKFSNWLSHNHLCHISGCCNKVSQTGCLINNQNVFLIDLKTGSLRSECQHSQVWVLSLLCYRLLFSYSFIFSLDGRVERALSQDPF